MTREDKILAHNKKIGETISQIEKNIEDFHKMLERAKKLLIPPCPYCKYEGLYRCEICSDNYFEGFDVKNYPY